MLSKSTTDQIRKEAEALFSHKSHQQAYELGAILYAEKTAHEKEGLVKALEEIQDCDFGEHIEIATKVLESFNQNKVNHDPHPKG